MGVGNAHDVEQTLDTSVFAEAAMQRIEHGSGLRRLNALQQSREITAHVDEDDAVAGFLERCCDCSATIQGNLAFGGEAAHEYGDALAHASPLLCLPIRRISQRNSMPLMSFTRRRTSSPNCSMSSPVAPP